MCAGDHGRICKHELGSVIGAALLPIHQFAAGGSADARWMITSAATLAWQYAKTNSFNSQGFDSQLLHLMQVAGQVCAGHRRLSRHWVGGVRGAGHRWHQSCGGGPAA